MGLDVIEIILTTEDVFSISIPDAEAGKISTFGDLYEYVCASLKLPPSSTRPVGTGRAHSIRKLRIIPDLEPWTHEDVWATLIAIFVEQMQFEPDEIWYDVRIGPDLGID